MEIKVKWRLNASRIRKAAEELGIRHEITIEKIDSSKWYAGCYMWQHDRHSIEVAKNWCVDAGYASEVIWHELTHALQDERLGRDGFKQEYGAQRQKALEGWTGEPGDGWSNRIRSMPLEQEAIEAQERAKDFPLVYIYGKHKV